MPLPYEQRGLNLESHASKQQPHLIPRNRLFFDHVRSKSILLSNSVWELVLMCPRISGYIPDSVRHLSLIRGVLSRPKDRRQWIFFHPFWADCLYFLPCLITAAFTCFSLVISASVACAVIYTIFPFENLAVRIAAADVSSPVVWLLVILQLLSLCVSEMGYLCLHFSANGR